MAALTAKNVQEKEAVETVEEKKKKSIPDKKRRKRVYSLPPFFVKNRQEADTFR